MNMLQAVNREKKSGLYVTEFGFLNKLVIYLYKAPGIRQDTPTHTRVYVCIYSLVDELLGIMKITRVTVKRNMAFLYYTVLIYVHMYLPTFSKP